jgi:hypothetical protein
MRREDAKVGMKVRISMTECKATQNYCGFRSQMLGLRGSITTITNIHANVNAGFSTTSGWAWHPKDLMPVLQNNSKVKPKKVKPVIFDEELLWTE